VPPLTLNSSADFGGSFPRGSGACGGRVRAAISMGLPPGPTERAGERARERESVYVGERERE